MIRSPICAVVGHVDHGKTTLLDTLRGTALANAEAGRITQAIGASIIPIEHIKERSPMIQQQNITVPGLLFIDTPGHAAFTGMRRRGGSLADIAVLLVDLNEGFKPQTKEAIEILKAHKTPFVIAANKVDLARGYRTKTKKIIEDINSQDTQTITYIETKLYEIVGQLAEFGINAERFDRLESFEKQIAIIPISALHGNGIDSLLAILVGLAQRYLESQLHTEVQGPARGSILEVSEVQGLGTTLDVILYDGTLRVGDTILVGTFGDPITTKVRALLEPNQLSDIRDRKTHFQRIDKAVAATGVKISAPNLDGAAAGMPIVGINEDEDEQREILQKQMHQVKIDTDDAGVVVKADNLGSLEALINLLREKNVAIRLASVGPLTKKELTVAESNPRELAAVLMFNLPEPRIKSELVTVLQADIIYKLIDDYIAYRTRVEEESRAEQLATIAQPARARVLDGCIFRQSNPLVCGVEVLSGTLRTGTKLVQEADPSTQVGFIKELQDKGESLKAVETGEQVAVSIPGAVANRHLKEGDVLWSPITEEEFRTLKTQSKLLSPKEKDTLREFAAVMREKQPLWGI